MRLIAIPRTDEDTLALAWAVLIESPQLSEADLHCFSVWIKDRPDRARRVAEKLGFLPHDHITSSLTPFYRRWMYAVRYWPGWLIVRACLPICRRNRPHKTVKQSV